MRGKSSVAGMVAAVALLASPSMGEAQTSTQVLIRVVANDAKIVGSGVGGARIQVREVATGRTLAEGIQEGGTGDTRRIMYTRERGSTVYDTEGAAGFLAELAIDEPTLVEVVAEGPLGTPEDLRKTSKTMLVMPGQHVLGEGVILELLGFTVELQAPEPSASIHRGAPFEVRGKVTMLCGCPTEPGGLWNSDEYRIVVQALQGGRTLGEWPMAFAGQTSWYTADVTLDVGGEVTLRMIAMDTSKGNFGMATHRVTVR